MVFQGHNHSCIFALAYLLAMQEIPPLNPFSINNYLSIPDIFSIFIPVIFNIASQINPGELNNDKDLIHKILNT